MFFFFNDFVVDLLFYLHTKKKKKTHKIHKITIGIINYHIPQILISLLNVYKIIQQKDRVEYQHV